MLFLTDLRGYDIVLGKLLSSSLDTMLGLIGIIPVLAIPMLLGGVSLGEFGRVTLSLVNTMFISLSVGLFVSALGRDSRRSALLAALIMVLFAFVLSGIAEACEDYYKIPQAADVVRLFSLLTVHERALEMVLWTRRTPFWPALLLTHFVGQTFLVLACWSLPRAWRERPARESKAFSPVKWLRRWQEWNLGQTPAGQAVRTRALELNPFCWLMARERVCSPGLLVVLVLILTCGLWIFWHLVAQTMRAASAGSRGSFSDRSS